MLPFSWQVLQAGPPKLWLRAPRCDRNMKRCDRLRSGAGARRVCRFIFVSYCSLKDSSLGLIGSNQNRA